MLAGSLLKLLRKVGSGSTFVIRGDEEKMVSYAQRHLTLEAESGRISDGMLGKQDMAINVRSILSTAPHMEAGNEDQGSKSCMDAPSLLHALRVKPI